MKRIGIITIQKCDNFGADLQAYALGAKLRSLGYDAENIDYLFYKHPRHLKSEKLEVRSEKLRKIPSSRYAEKPVLPLSLVNRIKERLFPIVTALRSFKHLNIQTSKNFIIARQRREKFAAWFKANVPCGREYRSVAALYADPPQYDVYITGSDQVWNPRMGSNILPYFLDFVPDGARCVSYAASIGVPSISPKVYDVYSNLLARYSAIGVREQTAERIIGGMGLRAPVRTVVDPTLLLTADEWQKVARRPDGIEPKTYVALYDLAHDQNVGHLASRVAAQLHARVIDVTDSAFGPGEFLWLMAHAAAAVCCSFHGTVFSMINRIPFYSVYSDGTGSNGGRIALFARSFGLGDRMVDASEVSSVQVDLHVDFEEAHRLLEERRKVSVDFLVAGIEGKIAPVDVKMPLACYALWAKDSALREKSTSGGAFYLLARKIIEQGGVVCGAVYDDDCRHVRHRCVRTMDELEPLIRSKYVYSNFTSIIPEMDRALSAGKPFLFVGTPCQVAAVRARYPHAKNLLTVDFVCHGTPKPEVFSAWIGDLESRYGERIVRYEFRNKERGWNFGESRVEFASGRILRLPGYADPYSMGFYASVFLRECCYSCRYANLNRPGDLTIADCWRVAASHPQYDDGKGTSLILVNTDAGRALFESVEKKQYAGGPYDLRLARLRNSPLMMPAVRSPYAGVFDAAFKSSGSLVKASACYFTPPRRFRLWLRGAVKRLLWFYLKHHQ